MFFGSPVTADAISLDAHKPISLTLQASNLRTYNLYFHNPISLTPKSGNLSG